MTTSIAVLSLRVHPLNKLLTKLYRIANITYNMQHVCKQWAPVSISTGRQSETRLFVVHGSQDVLSSTNGVLCLNIIMCLGFRYLFISLFR